MVGQNMIVGLSILIQEPMELNDGVGWLSVRTVGMNKRIGRPDGKYAVHWRKHRHETCRTPDYADRPIHD